MPYSAEVKPLENAEVEITAEIPADEFESYREEAVRRLGEQTEVEGFRKGNAPEAVLEQKVGQETILYEMAQQAISRAYPQIIAEHSVHALGRPQISITKIARDNPLGFTARTAIMPDVTLPEDMNTAVSKATEQVSGEDTTVTDEEVEQVVNEIRRSRAPAAPEGGEEGKTESGIITDPNQQEQGEEQQKEPELPELNDAFVQQLGDFKDVADFRDKIRANLGEEKERRERDKRRTAIAEAIQEEATLEVPAPLIASEQDRMLAQLKDNISQAGLTPEDYFKKVGKSEEEVKEEWKDEARKRARIQLVLQKIAEEKDIKPDEQEVEKQVDAVLQQFPGAEREQARAYVESVLTNEKVFDHLEGLVEKK